MMLFRELELLHWKSGLLLVLQIIGQRCQASDTSKDASSTAENRDTRLDLGEGAVMGNYEAGKTQVMNIRRDSQHPRYGTCWTNALEAVSAGCKRLTDDEQSRMALMLANCHLAKAGIDTYPCDETTSVKDCLHPIKDNTIAFNAYTEFFTHTQDICFFLQSQVWHQHTEQTVEKLAQSSEDVAEQLEVTGQLQQSMIRQQNISLKNQEQILAQEAQLREALKTSTNSIQEVFAEMKSSTLEQKALFAETFDRVAQVQKLMLGEFTWFNSVVYFVVVVLFAYMLTSTQRTSGARFGLFLLFLLNWVAEWMLFQVSGSNDQTLFHTRTWLCRKVFCVIGFLVLLYNACRYRDYDQINHALLVQIQKHLLEKGMGDHHTRSGIPIGAVQGTPLPGPLKIGAPAQLPAIKNSNRTEFSSGESDMDTTFQPENITSGSESHDSSPNEASFVADPSRRKHRTSNKVFSKTPRPDEMPSTSRHGEKGEEMGSSAKKRKGRAKGSRNNTPKGETPIFSASRYNLRNRSHLQSPNPTLDLETSLMFAQHVENLASRHFIIERTDVASSLEKMKRRKSPSNNASRSMLFSSDEEF